MGFLSSIKYGIADILCKIRERKWTFILCVSVSLVGFILGIVFFCISGYGWWYYNRCEFASKLPSAGFGVLLSFVVSTALIYLLYILCNMTRFTHYLALAVNLVACIYCGATVAAVFVYSAVWGVLYVILVAVPWLIIMAFACFVCMCEPPVCRSFCEAVRDLKYLLLVLAIGLMCKIIALFVVLKILTMLI